MFSWYLGPSAHTTLQSFQQALEKVCTPWTTPKELIWHVQEIQNPMCFTISVQTCLPKQIVLSVPSERQSFWLSHVHRIVQYSPTPSKSSPEEWVPCWIQSVLEVLSSPRRRYDLHTQLENQWKKVGLNPQAFSSYVYVNANEIVVSCPIGLAMDVCLLYQELFTQVHDPPSPDVIQLIVGLKSRESLQIGQDEIKYAELTSTEGTILDCDQRKACFPLPYTHTSMGRVFWDTIDTSVFPRPTFQYTDDSIHMKRKERIIRLWQTTMLVQDKERLPDVVGLHRPEINVRGRDILSTERFDTSQQPSDHEMVHLSRDIDIHNVLSPRSSPRALPRVSPRTSPRVIRNSPLAKHLARTAEAIAKNHPGLFAQMRNFLTVDSDSDDDPALFDSEDENEHS